MNDIEKLKKLNRLIPEMKKFGFAKTFDEAARQTEEFFSVDLPMSSQAQPQETPKPVKNDFEMRFSGLEASITGISQKINEIIKFLNDVEEKLKEHPAQNAAVEKSPVEAQPKIVVETKQSVAETKQSHPKNGEFTPDNIDIREYFNFGSRK